MWRPKEVIPEGKPLHISYRLRWNARPKLTPTMGRVTTTRSGPTPDGKRRIFVVEFLGAGRNVEGLKLDVGTSAGKLSNAVLATNPLSKGVRASFELDSGSSDVAELRLRLLRDGQPVTETWLYRWTAS